MSSFNRKLMKLVRSPGLYWRDYLLKRYPLDDTFGRAKSRVSDSDRRHGSNNARGPGKQPRTALALESIGSHPFPIDVVYTWVDLSDPAFKSAIKRHIGDQIGPVREGVQPSRWQCREELRFSLRSLFDFAPWVRRIFIVTNGQELPSWLNTKHPKISIVTHEEIIPSEHLPTFNSHVIESYLHHIEGLAEHYIYFNDDVMLLRPASPFDFFLPNGIALAGLSRVVANSPAGEHEPEPMWALKNSRQAIFSEWGYYFDRRCGHACHPQRRSVAYASEKRHAARYLAFRGNRFRGHEDLLTTGFLHHYEGYLEGKTLFIPQRQWYVIIRGRKAPAQLAEIMLERGNEKARLALCLNDHIPEDGERPNYEADLRDFMNGYYPSPSPYENSGIAPGFPAMASNQGGNHAFAALQTI